MAHRSPGARIPIPLWRGIGQYRKAEARRISSDVRPSTTDTGNWLASNFNKTLRRPETMIWETPTAIDLRFGLEITMYIANR
jgi:coenzyme PQQ precursor peptide PqqA